MTIQNLHLLPNLFVKNQLRDANIILLETNFITLRTLLYRKLEKNARNLRLCAIYILFLFHDLRPFEFGMSALLKNSA